jgi:PTS system nitrogen regulatory IIA component
MRLCEILSSERIIVDPNRAVVHDKREALAILGKLLAPSVGLSADEVTRRLEEREQLQSTGIGEGIAIPHTSFEGVPSHTAALVLCNQGIDFDAIDGSKVTIIFGVVGPKRSTGEHLKTLARISKLLKSEITRKRLVTAPDATAAFSLIETEDRALG